MIGIIFAMDSEVSGVLQRIQEKNKKTIGKATFYEYEDFVITKSGIGKINASIAATILIEEYHVTKILSIGISGAYGGIEQGTWMIGNTMMYHDVDCRYFGYEMGILPDIKHHFHCDETMIQQSSDYFKEKGFPYKSVDMAIGDAFIEKRSQVQDLYEVHPFVGIDMESTSICHVCYMFDIPVLAIRLVSDVLETKCPLSYPEFEAKSGEYIASVALDLIQKFKN